MKTQSTSASTIMVTAFSFLSAVFGFGRESYIAFAFGATGVTDAYYVSATIPDLAALWISYALTNSVVPVLKEELIHSPDSAKRLIQSVFWLATFVLLLITILAYFAQNPLSRLLAPGLSLDNRATEVNLLHIMLLSVIFTGLSGVLWGIHNAYNDFFYPAVVGVVYNVLLIVTAILLKPWVGIYGLAYGFVIGALGRFAIQFYPLVRRKQFTWARTIWHPAVRTILRLFPPIFISFSIGSVSVIVDRALASELSAGQVSALNYAMKLGLLPSTIIGMSVATTLYTRFVQCSVDQNLVELRRLLKLGLTLVVFLGGTIGAIFVLLNRDLIRMLFQHGAFTFDDVIKASSPLMIYGIFQVFYLIVPILTHFFYAKKDNRFVMRTSIAAVALNIGGSIILVRYLGINGLVLANSISQVYLVVAMLIAIRLYLKENIRKLLMDFILAGLRPAIIFGVSCLAVTECFPYHPTSAVMDALKIFVSILVASILTLGFLRIRRTNPIWLLISVLLSKLK